MIHCYMFEAKSIQSYIFRTGKLRDVIATSERLDQLIDTNNNSVLSKILVLLKFDEDDLNFIRRKGGAFYVYGNEDKLKKLRKIWTLTIQQLFPSMDFIDGISNGENLVAAIAEAHEKLTESRNNPTIKMPLFRTNMQLAGRTANPAVPFSSKIKHTDKAIDKDTNINRQTYQLMKDDLYKQYLYKKFIEEESYPDRIFPLDLNPGEIIDDKDSNKFPYLQNKNDLALIHIDGNGIGFLLKELKDKLKRAKQEDYKGIFKAFSNILCASTETAAKFATSQLISKLKNSEQATLPIRPLIMGGDDITLFCRADLALDYASNFCLAFQTETKNKLSSLYKKYKKLKLKNLPPYLTASGGIVYQKATQPFTAAHHLVEELCIQAKITSKDNRFNEIGMPALAFMRIATAQDDNYERLFNESYTVQIADKTIATAIGNYIVDEKDSGKTYKHPRLQTLIEIVDMITNEKSDISVNLLRKVLGQLHHGNSYEANNLINRAKQIADNPIDEIEKLFRDISGKRSGHWWLWDKADHNQQTILADVITLAKFTGDVS